MKRSWAELVEDILIRWCRGHSPFIPWPGHKPGALTLEPPHTIHADCRRCGAHLQWYRNPENLTKDVLGSKIDHTGPQ